MRNARKQEERTCLLNLFSCLPVLSPLHHGRLAKPRLLIQSLLRFGRLKTAQSTLKLKVNTAQKAGAKRGTKSTQLAENFSG